MIDKALLERLSGEIGIELTAQQLEQFDRYAELLVETNRTMNLTRVTEPTEIVIKHFVDSLTLLTAAKVEGKLVDVGTGAGFPGLALRIARPELDVTLIDSLAKRLTFLEQTAQAIGVTVKCVHLRAEEAGKLQEHRESYDFVTARAVAAMNLLCEYCLPLAKVGGTFAAMKGPAGTDELTEAENAIKLLGGKKSAVREIILPDGSERQIIIVEKTCATPKAYPRHGGKIAKKPL